MNLMDNLKLDLFYSKNSIDDEGRMYLSERLLNINLCEKLGIRSEAGKIYFYYLLEGKPIRWKSREILDKKKQKTSFITDEESKEFKMPFFLQFKDPISDDLIITEGEFDCIALRQLGASNVVSLPYGSGSVRTTFTNNYEFLQKFDRIFIAFDMDKTGEEAAKVAMQMLPPSKYRRINFPCKDANEWIIKENPIELKDLEVLMENATQIQDKNFINMAHVPKNYFEEVDIGISSGWKKLDDVLMGIRRGEVTVISGDTASGKSTFCLNLIKNFADSGNGIWINSYELKPDTVYRKIAGMILEKNMKIIRFSQQDEMKCQQWLNDRNCRLNISMEKVDIKLIRKQFEIASLVYNIKYILLDHLDYIHSAGKKKTTLENIDEAMQEIHSLALEFNIGVILVVHPTQGAGSNVDLSNLKGSSAIKQYADNIIIIKRLDLEKLAPQPFKVLIQVMKNRLFGCVSTFTFRYIPQIDGYSENY